MADADSTSQAPSGGSPVSSDSLAGSAMSSGQSNNVDVVTELFKLVGQLMGAFSGGDQPSGASSRQAADSFLSSVAGTPATSAEQSPEASADVGADVSLSPLAAGGQAVSPVSVSVSGPEL